jgi:hypothetical protein
MHCRAERNSAVERKFLFAAIVSESEAFLNFDT